MGRPDGPPADEFLRTARVLRGSALMAGQQPIARAAAGLEALARAYRDGRRAWDPATREQVGAGGRGVPPAGAPGARMGRGGDRAHRAPRPRPRVARRARTRCRSGAGRGRRRQHGELNTGVRAFVAREGALIASALDRAARALRASPGDREPLYTVIRRMQSLRGLAELSELVPLPEILDGIELAVGDLTRLFAPPPGRRRGHGGGLRGPDAHRRATSPSTGRPEAETEEAQPLHRAAAPRLRRRARRGARSKSLFFAGDPAPITPPLSQPQFAAPAPLGPLELVSHGEHLCQSADLIARPRSAIERDLRLYHLLGTLAHAPGRPGPTRWPARSWSSPARRGRRWPPAWPRARRRRW